MPRPSIRRKQPFDAGSLRSFSEAERAQLLDEALKPYIAKGWQVDDRFGSTGIISKEWGATYLLLGLASLASGTFGGGGSDAGERSFNRRYVSVDRHGRVKVERAPARGERVSRFDH